MKCKMVGFQTLSHPSLLRPAVLFQWEKRHTKNDKKTDYWFMDDRSMKWRLSRAVILFMLDANSRKQKEGSQICILGESLGRFVMLGHISLKRCGIKYQNLDEHYCLKCNGGAQRFPQAVWQPADECKGIRKPDCETDRSSRGESRA